MQKFNNENKILYRYTYVNDFNFTLKSLKDTFDNKNMLIYIHRYIVI